MIGSRCHGARLVLLLAMVHRTCCSGDHCVPAHSGGHVDTKSLLQKTIMRQGGSAPATDGFEAWQMTKVVEEPPASIPQRELPPCELANVTQACLPRFLVIGNQKSGSSTLFQVMRTHPQVLPARYKELLYFNSNLGHVRHCDPPETAPTPQEFAEYLGKFPSTLPGDDRLPGEFSATY
eukprot:CAMPEP_0179124396 /NCGR_PEP_ID=MMETSP0796-20121207/58783_1 /TAXON_ID=73915 /ORGANISM="Pyrodinium bahamense, Strain pbaha01" /LENGTH=178 /DNA_ID=CAMNT_0020823055 /DNA_START=63 /DNA_END=596 /DNA_ORIENTATION=-